MIGSGSTVQIPARRSSASRVLVAGEPIVDEPSSFGEFGLRHAQLRRLSARQRVRGAVRLGKLAPLVGKHIALGYAIARVVQQSEQELRLGLAAFGRPAKPNGGLAVILQHAQALEIEIAKPCLCISVFQPRERQPLLQRLTVLAPVEGGKAAPEILRRGGDRSAKEADEDEGQS